jgi:hypothetical protein
LKHQATGSRFKPTVRILKNMRNKLVNDGTLKAGVAPSYYIEGLMYNVPDSVFGTKHAATFIDAVKWIQQADRSKLVCANWQYYLFGSSAVQWPSADCDLFLSKTIDLWNGWS